LSNDKGFFRLEERKILGSEYIKSQHLHAVFS